MKANDPLTPRQIAFCNEYLRTNHGTDSYMLAYKVRSRDAARAAAARLLTQANIQRYLEKHYKKMEKKTQITVDEVVKRIDHLSKTALSDADKLKACDLLLRHLGGYVSARDLLDKMDEKTSEMILDELQKRLKSNEK